MAYLSDGEQPKGPEQAETGRASDAGQGTGAGAGAPEPGQGAPPPSPVPEPPRGSAGELRTIQTLITIAMISGPVSMVIGGVPLSLVAVVCALVALVKARRAAEGDEGADKGLAKTMARQATAGIVIGAVALVFNAVSLALVMPAFLEALQSGDMTALLGDGAAAGGAGGSADGAGGASAGSVWG